MANLMGFGKPIDLNTAKEWTNNFRDEFQDAVYGFFFAKHHLIQLLEQGDCEGMRAYKAINHLGEHTLVLVGVDINNNDLFEGILLEYAMPCPPGCSENSLLNSL